MGKKLNIDQFKQWMLENSVDIKCISNYGVDDKIDSKTELLFQCNRNHTFSKTITNFKKNPRCPHCTGKCKYTFEDAKRIVEAVEGYLLISTEYVRCKDYLIIQCDKGHPFPMTFTAFNVGGHRCPICNTGGKYKYDLEIAKEIFKLEKCELLVDEYIDCDTYIHALYVFMW